VGLDNVESAGIVHVLLGSSNGLVGNDFAPIKQGFDLTPGSSDAFDFFGGTLAAGNFGAGPADDLAVGARGEVLDGDDFAGAVTVFNNSPAGIGTKGVKVWHQDKKGLKDSAEESEYLGTALAAGNLGKSKQAELVIGVPYENVVNGGEGAVHVLYGSDKGLKSGGQQFINGNTPGVNGPALYDSAFGQTLTVANFGRGSQGDLAIGAPRRSVDGFMHGSVHVLYGSPTGVTIKGDQLWNQNTPGVTGKVQYVNLIGEGFGWDLVGANFGGSKYADLAVGVPYQTVDGFDLAGATQVLFGSEKGLTAVGDLYLTQKSAGVPSDPALNDSFGYTLTGAGFGRSARKDLAITSRDEDIGAAAAAGTVTVLYGSPNGPNTTTGEVWSQDTLNVEGAAATSDRFGNALAP
ncbi:MAG TPA: hypothetical protein VEV82_04120, partial [Actinomycetota bacterium]|nr:hypothetical protein [Actinomycetota bacterium]